MSSDAQMEGYGPSGMQADDPNWLQYASSLAHLGVLESSGLQSRLRVTPWWFVDHYASLLSFYQQAIEKDPTLSLLDGISLYRAVQKRSLDGTKPRMTPPS
jgi:hypothetical protein